MLKTCLEKSSKDPQQTKENDGMRHTPLVLDNADNHIRNHYGIANKNARPYDRSQNPYGQKSAATTRSE